MKLVVVDGGERLDVYCASNIEEINRSTAQKLIKKGDVLVNGKVKSSSYTVREGDVLSVDLSLIKPLQTNLNIPVIYEDNDCVVLDKPHGVLTHSKGALSNESTVATFIKGKVNGLEGNRAGIVHRLDRGTSGVIICAKNENAQKWLQKQFSTRNVKKTYIAVVTGSPDKKEAVIDMPIERNPKEPQKFRVGVKGKPAKTHYKVLKSGPRHSLVELKPETGRTHQLRVHMKQIGHTIIGDDFYGGEEADRLYLHAAELELKLPNGEIKTFVSKLPTEFSAIMS